MANIIYTDWGLGNNYGDGEIELNVNLKKYPKLHNQILNHELKHTDNTFSKEDLKIDFFEDNINQLELFKFLLLYPKALTQFLPFSWHRKYGFVYDFNYIITYSVIFGLIALGIYFAMTV